MANTNLRDAILNKKDIQSEVLHVKSWDVNLEVRGLTGAARARILNTCMDKQGNMDLEKLYPEMIIACTFDPKSGEPIFGPADREAINAKSGAALEEVAQVAIRLSGLGGAAVDKALKN